MILNGSELMDQNHSRYFIALTLLCASLIHSACVTKKRQVAQYNWDFKAISDKPTAKAEAFEACDAASRRRFRFVSDYEEQVFRYASGVASCMRLEGWGVTKNPVSYRDQAG
jgi:hypothetical protein